MTMKLVLVPCNCEAQMRKHPLKRRNRLFLADGRELTGLYSIQFEGGTNRVTIELDAKVVVADRRPARKNRSA